MNFQKAAWALLGLLLVSTVVFSSVGATRVVGPDLKRMGAGAAPCDYSKATPTTQACPSACANNTNYTLETYEAVAGQPRTLIEQDSGTPCGTDQTFNCQNYTNQGTSTNCQ
jgi:hypothetical protein